MAAEEGSQAFHGGAVGARVTAILDAANADAAAIAAAAEDDARERLAAAHDEARDAFQAAADAAREFALERVATLTALRQSIAERSESLIAEADDPVHVNEQVEALLLALSETEAALLAPGEAWEPAPPEGLEPTPEPQAVAEPEPLTEPEPMAEPEPDEPATSDPRPATPFGRWANGRRDGQVLALLRMAVAGVTRDELERELDPALPAEEREELLDDVFGAPHKSGQHADGNGGNGRSAATQRV
jgi:hypothetical protein